MRIADLMRFALGALTHHKLRTMLTVLGVLLGSFTLVLSLSVGLGVQATATEQFHKHAELLQIEVWPGRGSADAEVPAKALELKGRMDSAKEERIRRVLRRRWLAQHAAPQKKPLDRKELAAIEQLPHVARVVPSVILVGRAYYENKPGEQVYGFAADQQDQNLRDRLVAGQFFSSPSAHEVLVHEYLLYEWDLLSEEQVRGVLGKTLQFRFPIYHREAGSPLYLTDGDRANWTPAENEALRQALGQVPAQLERLDLPPLQRDVLRRAISSMPLALPSERERNHTTTMELVVRGVFRESDEKARPRSFYEGDGVNFALPLKTGAEELLQAQGETSQGFEHALVFADDEANVRAVNEAITARGLHTFCWVEALDQLRMTILLITFATGFIAVIALVVAAIGIANVMLMSVLERTREIGVMKAVGAREGHIQLIFLIEGAVLGLVGGGLGLVAGWLASFPGNAAAASMISERMKEPFEGTVFIFPPWLLGTVLAFSMLVTTLAALYPARRASRINPIIALRTE